MIFMCITLKAEIRVLTNYAIKDITQYTLICLQLHLAYLQIGVMLSPGYLNVRCTLSNILYNVPSTVD